MNGERRSLYRFALIPMLIVLLGSIGLAAASGPDAAVAVMPGIDPFHAGAPAGPDVAAAKPIRLAADSATFDTLAHRFALEPNRPNPFPGATTISYSLNAASHVELTVYDFFYRKVQTIVSTDQAAGRYSVQWPNDETTENPSSGIYFCTLTANGSVEQLRMVLLK